MSTEAVRVTDLRTDKTIDVPVEDGAIRAISLRQLKTSEDDFGMMTYDPAYQNTASCKSRITFIDGDKGILRYRGYPIEQLAEKSSFLEVAYTLLDGELPSAERLDAFRSEITSLMPVPGELSGILNGFQKGAHPMGILMALLSALGTYKSDSRDVLSSENRLKHCAELIAKVPVLAAMAFRHNAGKAPIAPDPSLSYAGNFLRLIFADGDGYEPHAAVERAMDVLFTLHADHEQNCSAAVMRSIGSSQADPYSAMAGATAALWGPLHGGANEAVLRMLDQIGSKDNVADFIRRVKDHGDVKLMGFGHRVYKNYDPRAKIIKGLADDVFKVQGDNPLLDIAKELEQIALADEFFIERKLYPNVDFYSGLIYQSLGFPPEFFTVLFAIGRTPGWLSQWHECMADGEQKIARPRQLYLGSDKRDYPA
ncbi:MAG: citrate synthase [Planctomycetota bacterium]